MISREASLASGRAFRWPVASACLIRIMRGLCNAGGSFTTIFCRTTMVEVTG